MTNANQAHYFAVVPAAGVGLRMGGDIPKQYLPLLGKTVIEYTMEKLLAESRLNKIILVTHSEDDRWCTLPVLKNSRIEVITGGDQRCHSVFNGLQHLRAYCAKDDWVLVHDVARPCVANSDIKKMIEILKDDHVGGLVAVPITDTIKQVNCEGLAAATINRDRLWKAQTPQMFRFELLLNAMADAIDKGRNITDEAMALELSGMLPKVIEGSLSNIKITRLEDLSLAEYYLHTKYLHNEYMHSEPIKKEMPHKGNLNR